MKAEEINKIQAGAIAKDNCQLMYTYDGYNRAGKLRVEKNNQVIVLTISEQDTKNIQNFMKLDSKD